MSSEVIDRRIKAQNILSSCKSDDLKLSEVFQIYKDELQNQNPQLYYALLGWSDSHRREFRKLGLRRIYNLPDGTFFYANNGAWKGYVTTENGKKICYAGVTSDNPTKEYISRFEVSETYELNISTLE